MTNLQYLNFLIYVLTMVVGISTLGPMAQPPIGPIRGSIIKSRLGKDIYSFRGVKYAEPPTKENRFKPAIPAKNWIDVFDATQEGPACIRPMGSYLSEDCLRLNVYTTELPQPNQTITNKPVIVFFPPTAVVGYSAQSHVYGPHYLLDKDIVLVTVNSRVCTLGFISTGDANAPGNLAYKDQVESLKWIKKNIQAFGGDPGSVTITGCGGGAVGVILHMLSPMSKGLFHKAIAMSGSPLTLSPLPRHQLSLAQKQAQLLNCPITPTEQLLTCLRTKPTEDFRRTIREFFKWHNFPTILWSPVIEPDIPGVERFLTDSPMELIRQGKINQVPLIIGTTKDELGGFIIPHVRDTNRLRQLNENWNELAPINFHYDPSNDSSSKIRDIYFQNRDIGFGNIQQLAELYSDSLIRLPVLRFAKLLSNQSKEPVYLYKFTFQGEQSFAMWNNTTPYGVEHQDDLQYLFYMSYRFVYADLNSPMIERMTELWSNYVHNVNFVGLKWDKLEPNWNNYLELNVDSVMRNESYSDRMIKLEDFFF